MHVNQHTDTSGNICRAMARNVAPAVEAEGWRVRGGIRAPTKDEGVESPREVDEEPRPAGGAELKGTLISDECADNLATRVSPVQA